MQCDCIFCKELLSKLASDRFGILNLLKSRADRLMALETWADTVDVVNESQNEAEDNR